ncbi:MAG: 50S ribosomal protein L23 [Nitrospirae bacterium]|nr:50S ribosomal protein L23 [Nitrospirota bacterium]MBF0521113.1 50S ribosomal protein L23 [Nitrospirota bacterium]MBF0534262.1 50S ribosomal protein L23 [Nitrospirota bacterium]MBF0615757.1 50S ribosomal protein L23 [Nitrospirota bacterium]QWR77024.1 50S ribosomal protein L23 [Nitrospirales bacterium LBB_01]
MKDAYTIIKRPMFTEKGTFIKELNGKLLIEVDMSSNKIEIKRAFEEIFKVKVVKVSTITQPGKWKKYGKSIGMTQTIKKAIVTLGKGEKLDFIEGV